MPLIVIMLWQVELHWGQCDTMAWSHGTTISTCAFSKTTHISSPPRVRPLFFAPAILILPWFGWFDCFVVVPKLENEHGVICQETCFGYRLFHRTNSEPFKDNGYATHRYPFCDVFVMRRQEVSHKQSKCDSLLVECASATARLGH